MGLTKQYLRYVPDGVFNLIADSRCNVVFVTLHGQEGRFVAAGGGESVVVWDLRLSEKTVVLPGEKVLVTRLAASPNGTQLSVGYADGNIKIFDLESAELICTLAGHRSSISSLMYDNNGTRLASGAKDTEVIVWDIVGERGLHRLSGHKGAITQALFMSDKEILVTSGRDSFIKFWDLETAHCFITLSAHKAEVWDIALLRDGRYLVSGGTEPELFVWEIEENAPSNEGIFAEDNLTPLRCKKVGSLLRNSYGRLQALVSDKSGQVLSSFGTDFNLEVFWFCSDEEVENKLKKKRLKQKARRAKSAENDELEKDVDDQPNLTEKVKRLVTIKCSDRLKSCDLIMGKTGEIRCSCVLASNKIELYSIPSKKSQEATLLRTLEKCGHRSEVKSVCFSSDALAVATASADSIKVWNRTSQSCLRTITTGYVTSLTFVPGDRHLLAGLKSGSILVLDISTAEILEEISAHQSEVWAVCVTPTNRGCVSGSGDKTLKFWDFESVTPISEESSASKAKVLSLLHTRSLQLEEGVLCVAISPNMRYVAASLLDSTVKIFFLDTLKFFVSLYGHKLPVLCMDISFDSTVICTGSADRNVKIWGLDFGDCHKSIFAHDDSIKGLKFVPKTHYFFTCGKDGRVKQWDADNYERILTLDGHLGAAHSLDVSSTHVVSCGGDRVVRVFTRTAEPLVLEDEREEERQQEDDAALVTGQDSVVPGQANHSLPSKKTVGAERAAEQLIEAIQLADSYGQDLELWDGSEATKPPPPPLMIALQLDDPNKFILHALKSIKASDIEEALLLIPFSNVCMLLNRIPHLLRQKNDVETVARSLLFLVKVHHEPIVQTKKLLMTVKELSTLSIESLNQERDRVGVNLFGLRAYQRRVEAEQSVQIFREATLVRREKEKKRRLKEKAIKRAVLSV
ncbi:WD repeat-containing protein 3 [Neocloeon triangulifer]|uniref:WD repeat-containing protein 3 n=1 Tax=Neocloeon triangulifer TaxID=2078957 RepID=UPI00286F4A0D|nr:WD repeat-containing protein 3 [Neocloeon triangulifer]